MSLKKKLRKKIQGKRDSLSAQARRQKSMLAAERFFQTPYYKESRTILCYYPFRSEIDTTIIIEKALKDNRRVILPRVEQKSLKLYYVQDLESQLKIGSYGIMEPAQGSKPARLDEIDLALVPGVAFDRGLNRLGYGGGFYDRLLCNLSPEVKKVVLCFEVQVVDKLPTLEHDIEVDIIITESEEIIGPAKK